MRVRKRGTMADIVNLNRARKAKLRREKDERAAANRVLHGAPKRERKRAEAERDKAVHDLDAHRRDGET